MMNFRYSLKTLLIFGALASLAAVAAAYMMRDSREKRSRNVFGSVDTWRLIANPESVQVLAARLNSGNAFEQPQLNFEDEVTLTPICTLSDEESADLSEFMSNLSRYPANVVKDFTWNPTVALRLRREGHEADVFIDFSSEMGAIVSADVPAKFFVLDNVSADLKRELSAYGAFQRP
ncbi:hypothetical protein Pla175_04590 [Pirellulimonas nuda]|uniref:DUF302 domain-containing protein n=1 Tax=Pirellulimonas nuda TaxID=2528009 RepID=A0A518D6J2_9BACT|nr:hypothetical protein [Pirellulimonas nuda]QDU87104.1 hypothetical protein Pla175_04590 [Pirellulimonas nuda]